MRRFLMIVGLLFTLSNVTLGIAYACTCDDSSGGCSASGSGASCWHDQYGMCHCTDGKGAGELGD